MGTPPAKKPGREAALPPLFFLTHRKTRRLSCNDFGGYADVSYWRKTAEMWKYVYLVLKLCISRAGVRNLVGGGKTIKKLCPVFEHGERAIVTYCTLPV